MEAKLWVKYKKNHSTQVSTKDCENEGRYISQKAFIKSQSMIVLAMRLSLTIQ